MLVYVPRQRNAAASRTWLLLIFLCPGRACSFTGWWAGFICQKTGLNGRSAPPKKSASCRSKCLARRAPAQPAAQCHAAGDLATRLGDFEPLNGNQVELLTDYPARSSGWLPTLTRPGATSICCITFTRTTNGAARGGGAGARGRTRGAKCRVLLDAVGPRRRCAGWPGDAAPRIEVTAAFAGGLFRRNAARFDLRNHRKIAVIDGKIGYSGSQNITNGKFVTGFPNEEIGGAPGRPGGLAVAGRFPGGLLFGNQHAAG